MDEVMASWMADGRGGASLHHRHKPQHSSCLLKDQHVRSCLGSRLIPRKLLLSFCSVFLPILEESSIWKVWTEPSR